MFFNPETVFESLHSFLSSGYIFLAALVFLGIGLVKKLIGMLVIFAIMLVIWLVCHDEVIAALNELLSFLG